MKLFFHLGGRWCSVVSNVTRFGDLFVAAEWNRKAFWRLESIAPDEGREYLSLIWQSRQTFTVRSTVLRIGRKDNYVSNAQCDRPNVPAIFLR